MKNQNIAITQAIGQPRIIEELSIKSRTAKEHIERYRFAGEYVKNKYVLDIACGIGYGTEILWRAGAKTVSGMDSSAEVIKYANEHYYHPGIKYFLGDAEKYFNFNEYDVIVSFETIEHLNNCRLVLENFYKSLKSGGKLILSTPNRPVFSPPGGQVNPLHIHEFEIDEITNEVRGAGFNDVQLFAQCKPLKFANRIFQKLNRAYQKYSSRYSPSVKPIKEVGTVRYIIVVAIK